MTRTVVTAEGITVSVSPLRDELVVPTPDELADMATLVRAFAEAGASSAPARPRIGICKARVVDPARTDPTRHTYRPVCNLTSIGDVCPVGHAGHVRYPLMRYPAVVSAATLDEQEVPR